MVTPVLIKLHQEHMSRPKGSEGASDFRGLPTDVLDEVLKAVFPCLEHTAGAVHSRLVSTNVCLCTWPYIKHQPIATLLL